MEDNELMEVETSLEEVRSNQLDYLSRCDIKKHRLVCHACQAKAFPNSEEDYQTFYAQHPTCQVTIVMNRLGEAESRKKGVIANV